MRSKEELRDRILLRHRSGDGYKINYAALKVPKSIVASIIIKWKNLEVFWNNQGCVSRSLLNTTLFVKVQL